MGSSEIDKSSKEAKEAKESKARNSQEQASTTTAAPVNPDWSGFQAYSPMPPHGFMASRPQRHPYMLGVQQFMPPPHGTPPHPYVAMYPHGGIYAHPSMPLGSYPFSPFAMPSPNGVAEASVRNPGNVVVDGKSSEGKAQLPIKRSKGSLGSLNIITGKNDGPGKTSGASANGAYSKSAVSGIEGSSDGSYAHSQIESPMNSGGRQDSADSSQDGNAAHGSLNGAPHSMINQTMAIVSAAKPGGIPGVPATNLNIGIDYWGAATSSSSISAMHGKVPISVAGELVTAGSRDSVQSQMWIQEHKSLKSSFYSLKNCGSSVFLFRPIRMEKRQKTRGCGVGIIQEEIIMDILSRLPVKSLLRFKCVSESWNKLISEPYFKKMHLNIHQSCPQKKLLISVYSHKKQTVYFHSSSLLSSSDQQLVKDIRRLDRPSSIKPRLSRVYCCCDGLFFMGIWYALPGEGDQLPPILLLWNPSTGESILLPTQYPESTPEEYTYGLGYDSTTDDYKILRINAMDQEEAAPDEILALKSGSWRKINETAGGMNGIQIQYDAGGLCLAFVDGAFHWLAGEKYCVVSFNISNETYGEIPLPVKVPSSNSMIEEDGMLAVGGRLCYYNNDFRNFNLWVMKEYGIKESWTKWVVNLASTGITSITPIHSFSDEEVLLSYYGVKGTVYRTYNGSFGLSNRRWPLHCDANGIGDGFVYTESLISPKLGSSK